MFDARPHTPFARYAVGVLRVLLAMLGLLVVGCSRTEPAPSDTHSTEPRIVVLSPALAAILDDMGYADHVVGRHGWDRVLDPAIPVCGEQGAINSEALLRVKPTHVLVEWGSRELPDNLTDLAQRHGWVVRDFHLLTLEDIDRAATELGELFPGAVPGERISRFHGLVAGPAPEPRWGGRVLLLMSASPIMALGPGSAHHELLVRAGGVPAIEQGSPSMMLHAEDVLRLAPDAIVLIQPSAPHAEGPGTISMEDALGAILDLEIPAVEYGRFELVHEPFGLLPSTRLVGVAAWIERALTRWAEE